jgi:formylglycine-generating enzyme required for sulfatase activity
MRASNLGFPCPTKKRLIMRTPNKHSARIPQPAVNLAEFRGRRLAQLVAVLIAGFGAGAAAADGACNADIDSDNLIGAGDLAQVLGAWGPCAGCAADVDSDGVVDGADLSAVLGNWGVDCTPLAWATILEQLPDPSVIPDAQLRDAIIATGLPWRVVDNVTEIEMLLVPPDLFNMGCSPSLEYDCLSQESPVHLVTLTDAYYIGRYEVTQRQWQNLMGSNPSFHQPPITKTLEALRPVESISWNTIQGFLSASGLRLPTEAEWERAYRAGSRLAFHAMPGFPLGTDDDALVDNIGWFVDNTDGHPAIVGLKSANALGLHDMAGNVWELTSDWFGDFSDAPAVNPTGPASGTGRAMRGGCYVNVTWFLRSSTRYGFMLPDDIDAGVGFRVARNP